MAGTTSASGLLFEAKPRWSGTIGAGGVAAANTTTIPISSAANLDNGDAYVFVVNRVNSDASKNDLSEMETVIGELSGTNFINCDRGLEGTAQAWDAGTVVEILFTATHWNKMIDAFTAEHSADDGTHNKTGVDVKLVSGTAGTTNYVAKWNADGDLVDGHAIIDDDTMATASATTLATSESIKAYVDTSATPNDGWLPVSGTWAYASATTITVPAGAAALYQVGDKIKLTQTTAKYFYVVGVADTVLTVSGGTTYTVADAAITSPFYSKVSNPLGFPHWFAWTPIIRGDGTAGTGTYTTQEGRFRIENGAVDFVAKIVWTNLTGHSGTLGASIPFTASAAGLEQSMELYNMVNVTHPAGAVQLIAFMSAGAETMVHFYAIRDAGTNIAVAVDTAGSVWYGGRYEI